MRNWLAIMSSGLPIATFATSKLSRMFLAMRRFLNDILMMPPNLQRVLIMNWSSIKSHGKVSICCQA